LVATKVYSGTGADIVMESIAVRRDKPAWSRGWKILTRKEWRTARPRVLRGVSRRRMLALLLVT